MIAVELSAQISDGFGVAEELPAAEGWGEVVELGDRLGEAVDLGGNWGA